MEVKFTLNIYNLIKVVKLKEQKSSIDATNYSAAVNCWVGTASRMDDTSS